MVWSRVGLIVVALAAVVPIAAHHSGAMFNSAVTTTLVGSVKEFQWTNPHCWIQLSVAGEGGTEEWSIEMGAPLQLYQGGWRPSSLKPGDAIEVVVNPLHDTSVRGGLFISAKRADGTPVGAQL
jgi:hypothetical protein